MSAVVALREELLRMYESEAALRADALQGTGGSIHLDVISQCAGRISSLSSSDEVGERMVTEACKALVSAAASACAAYEASSRTSSEACAAAVACCLPVGDLRTVGTAAAVGARTHMLRIVSHLVCCRESDAWPVAVKDQAIRMAEMIAAVLPDAVSNSREMWQVYESGIRSNATHGLDASARFMLRVVEGPSLDWERVDAMLTLMGELHGTTVLAEDYRISFNRLLSRQPVVPNVKAFDRSVSSFVRVCRMHAMATGGNKIRIAVTPAVCSIRGAPKVCCNSCCTNLAGPAAQLVKIRRCPQGDGLAYCGDECHHKAWSRHMCPCRSKNRRHRNIDG